MKPATTKTRKRVHKSGKFTGYDDDGETIWPAPTFTEPMARLYEEQLAIEQLVQMVSGYATTALAGVHRRVGGLLDQMAEEFGLARGEFNYSYTERIVKRMPKEGKPAVDPQARKQGDSKPTHQPDDVRGGQRRDH